MKPEAANLDIALDYHISEHDKTKTLLSGVEAVDRPEDFLNQAIERVLGYAEPYSNGLPTDGPQPKHSSYLTPPRTIEADRPLALQFFVYAPTDPNYGRSLMAIWLEPEPAGDLRTVYKGEYVTANNFIESKSAYNPDEAAKRLQLLAQSIEAYERAAP